MQIKLSEIALKLDGTVFGDDIEVDGLCSIEVPVANSISMIFSKKILKKADISVMKAFVVAEGIEKLIDKPCIVIKKTEMAIIKLIEIFYPEEDNAYVISDKADICTESKIVGEVRIDAFAVVSKGVRIDNESVICSNVHLGKNVQIGSNCLIYPNVTIYDDCIIGNNVIIHSSTVIGADGFGYVNTAEGHFKIRQVGNVVIEDNVEIGANVSIDRATFASTIIGEGTKIDNLVQIAHNVVIGKHSIIVSQAGIAGSTKIGNFVIVGGQAAIPDHVKIADGVILGARTGVMSDIKERGIYFGTPAQSHREFLKNMSASKDLYKMKKQLESLMEDKND